MMEEIREAIEQGRYKEYKAEKEIVGEWKCSNFLGSGERSIVFNKDGTGTTDIFSGGRDFKWKY